MSEGIVTLLEKLTEFGYSEIIFNEKESQLHFKAPDKLFIPDRDLDEVDDSIIRVFNKPYILITSPPRDK